MKDKLSAVERGELRWELSHNREFRNQIKRGKLARHAESAVEAETAEIQAAQQERDEERANRKPGSMSDGRQRWEETHGASGQHKDGDN